jgi:dienelactone hydrolase
MKKKVTVLLFWSLFLNVAENSFAQENSLWGELKAGPYSVGFKRIYELDYSRTYTMQYIDSTSIVSEKEPRPMIINIWYPAENEGNRSPMKYEEYFNFKCNDSKWKLFLERIKKFNNNAIQEYSFSGGQNKSEKSIQLNLLQQLLKTNTACFKDAKAVSNKFPLIVYHPGIGGTIEESSLMCEYLVSYGYVVVSSAYQPQGYLDNTPYPYHTSKYLNPDWDLERANKDRDFLINYMSTQPNIDLRHIASMGFSFGAQSSLYYRAENNSPIDLLLLFDTALDFAFDYNPSWFKTLTKRLYDRTSNLNVPMLIFSRKGASFFICDSLKNADRYYCTVSNFDHYDFTSQYEISHLLNFKLRPDSTLLKTKFENYIYVCNYTLAFLNANFKKDEAAIKFIQNDSKENGIRPDRIYREKMPVGKSGRDVLNYEGPPSERQISYLLFTKGVSETKQICEKYRILFNEDLINNYGYVLLYQPKKIDEAIEAFEWNVENYPASSNAYDSLGEAYKVKGNKNSAIINYKKSLVINPANANAKKMLKILEE